MVAGSKCQGVQAPGAMCLMCTTCLLVEIDYNMYKQTLGRVELSS